MSNPVTITEGLENLGPLNTGTGGSIFKARRSGNELTVVRVFPTPVKKSPPEKKFIDFKNQFLRLKSLNENQSPHIVKFLHCGITDLGNYPFMEMEFVEGPDIDELLEPPHPSIFSIRETCEVARHLADALAHSHKSGIKHGSLNNKNVKYNVHTGNYVLLNFKPELMLEESHIRQLTGNQRKFLAPEQLEGNAGFQSDIYSFGVILYRLLTGTYPVRDTGILPDPAVVPAVTHAPLAQLAELRNDQIPETWAHDKKEKERQLPQWLLDVISRCLEENPDHRFTDGEDLLTHISVHGPDNPNKMANTARIYQSSPENNKWSRELEQLRSSLESDQFFHKSLLYQFEELKNTSREKDRLIQELHRRLVRHKISRAVVYVLLALATTLTAMAGYYLFDRQNLARLSDEKSPVVKSGQSVALNKLPPPGTGTTGVTRDSGIKKQPTNTASNTITPQVDNAGTRPGTTRKEAVNLNASDPSPASIPDSENEENLGLFKVKSRAYFHDEPDASTRRRAYITHWNNAVLEPLAERDDFFYVVFTNHLGQTSSGWLRKKDLIPADESP